jgi:6-methylsalicylate decarboxylase
LSVQHSSAAIALRVDLADPANVLFGSDFPFMPAATTEEAVAGLAESPEWTDGQKAAIGRDDALRLLSRLAARIQLVP